MASVSERQELASKLRSIEADSSYIAYATGLDNRLRDLPELPSFTERQVLLEDGGRQLDTLSDCTAVVRLGSQPDAVTYDEWRGLMGAYFHDEEYPVGYDESLADDLDLAVELVKRDAVAKACVHGRVNGNRLSSQLTSAQQADAQARSQWKRQVAEAVAAPKQEIEQINQQLYEIGSVQSRRAAVGKSGVGQLLSDKEGCLTWIAAGAALLVVNYLTFNILLSIGAAVAVFFAGIAISVYFTNMSNPTSKEEAEQDALMRRREQLENYVSGTEAEPAELRKSRAQIKKMQQGIGAANGTLRSLGKYEWPLTATECQTLAEVSRDLSTSAGNLREANRSVIQRSIEQALAHRTQVADGIGLMPNAVPDALELATIVENGYADDVKEAMLFMATDRYRTSNLALQAQQIREIQISREENSRYMRQVIRGISMVSDQLVEVNEGIDTVSGQLKDMHGTLRSIDRSASSAAESAAETARQAARAADAAEDLRKFYAEDHPDRFGGTGTNMRLRR